MSDNPFVGNWTYRSFLNDPDINKSFNDLEFGVGTLVIEEASANRKGHDRRQRLVAGSEGRAPIRRPDARTVPRSRHRQRREVGLRLQRLSPVTVAERR